MARDYTVRFTDKNSIHITDGILSETNDSYVIRENREGGSNYTFVKRNVVYIEERES